LIHGWAF